MPIYEFVCPIHGKFERIFPLSQYKEIVNGTLCKAIVSTHKDWKRLTGSYLLCGEIAEKIPSIPGNIQLAPASRIFFNTKTGESYTAASNEKVPYGCIEKELKGPLERSKYEKRMERYNAAKDEVDTLNAQFRRDQHQKQRHDNLKANMNALQTEIHPDTGEKIQHYLEPKHKKMLKDAMERSKKRVIPKKVTEGRFAINHTDRSNLVDTPRRAARPK